MSDSVARLEPRVLWEHFAALCAIPRPSGGEDAVAAHVRKLAERHAFEVRSDAAGNLVVAVPATPGLERAPVVILQGHLDMVCEKNGEVRHDFSRDPIRARLDGEWVRATGTTLGADNGIGVAAALAIATNPSVRHGPLELLFTVDEETGLTGAKQLDGTMLRGRILLNLDSEEDGAVFVGCAGGADTHLMLAPRRSSPPKGASAFRLRVAGLRGGHSGLNIHENRGNAIRLLARVLDEAAASRIPVALASLSGGSKHNAIPREAEARLYLSDRGRFEEHLARMRETFAAEFEGIDEGLALRLEPLAEDGPIVEAADAERLVRLLVGLPHGVLGMSPAIPGLVETSSNLAVIRPDGTAFRVVTSSRSSVAPALRSVLRSIAAIGTLAGADVETHDGYPGWKPDLSSRALAVVSGVYRKRWGREPRVTAIHAGLECGLLGEKIPGLDMVSFGPQIEGAHSPDESVNVPSVARFWDALRDVVLELCANGSSAREGARRAGA